MDEQQWLTSDDPVAMLHALTAWDSPFKKIGTEYSPRKLRLFACACVRQVWDKLTDLDPDRLAILADALEEAGCDNVDILLHLRSQHEPDPDPTPWELRERANNDVEPLRQEFARRLNPPPIIHVRGCWAVDLCLGRE